MINTLFCDGHVKTVNFLDVSTNVTAASSCQNDTSYAYEPCYNNFMAF
jgi:prepilin-type processing-associated H-X9-DG protein